MANDSCQIKKSKTPRWEKIRTILDISILILWSVNTLANSSGIGKRLPGRNVTGGSITIIERYAPQLPNSFREMEPLFLAVICGCNAGLFREALHEVYIPRIQRGNAYFVGQRSWSERSVALGFGSFL